MEENKEIESSVNSARYCYACYELLDANKICWNTNFEGTGENCPTYGIPQE